MYAALVASIGDMDRAEEALQDAYAEALSGWGAGVLPTSPAAWLVTAAKRRALDRTRSDVARSRREGAVSQSQGASRQEDPTENLEDSELPDERLRLLFMCCHPALAPEAQVALTLRAVSGLSTEAIASAFLIPKETLAQRLVRAKKKIREAGIPFAMPTPDSFDERVSAAMSVVYLVFNEGYVCSEGTQLLRHELCAEAIALGSLLVELAPSQGETHGLLALMMLLDARREGRVDADGLPLLLADQDRSSWDKNLIAKGVARIGAALSKGELGPYGLQAAIAAAHAEAVTAEQTPWSRIVALYDRLVLQAPTPVVRLNRVAALAMERGPRLGLVELSRLESEFPGLQTYLWFWTLRAELHVRQQEVKLARSAYNKALALAGSEVQRAHIKRRLDAVSGGVGT